MSEQILTNEQIIETPVPQKKKRSLARLITDAVLLVVVLALAITTFASFATPLTRIGDNSVSGESMSLIDYLIGQNSSSILSQILNYLDMTEISDAQIMSIVATLIRAYIMIVLILVYVIVTLVNVIKAIVCFFAKKPLGLATSAV